MIESLELTRRSLFDGSVYQKWILTPTAFIRIKNISGLGPVKANVSRAPSAANAGSTYLGYRVGERVITMTLEMTTDYADDYSLSDVRRNITSLLDPGAEIEMRFHLDDISVDIKGIVDSHDPEMFVDTPIAVVSIICPDPFFKFVGNEVVKTWAKGSAQPYVVDYVGRQLAPVGFKFQATLDNASTTSYPQLTQDGVLRGLLGVPGYAFEAGDTLKFNTIRGQRGVSRIRSFAENDILGFFQGSLMDFQILPGKNYIKWNRANSSTGIQLSYRPQYTGL